MTDEDLGYIGGPKNIGRTYKTLKTLGQRFIPITYVNDDDQIVKGRFHWIDSFMYNTHTKMYDVRISPELMGMFIDIKKNFTYIDVGEAMTFRSAKTQKMYEYISSFSRGYRYPGDKRSRKLGYVYAKNVIPVSVDKLRHLFNLDELRDERTNEVERKRKYATNYNGIKTNILKKAQRELYQHYAYGTGCTWFDFRPLSLDKRGSKVKTVLIYIYTKDHPKQGPDRPWQEGDPELDPYDHSVVEEKKEQEKKQTPTQRMHANPFYKLGKDCHEQALLVLLRKYLSKDDIAYYMGKAQQEAHSRKFNAGDAYMNMIQVIQDKEHQPKFKTGTPAFRRNCLITYVFTKNLQHDFGWCIPPAGRVLHLRKKKPSFTGFTGSLFP